MTATELSKYIEHTRLSPLTTGHEIENLIEEALTHHFVGICIPPFWVKKASRDIGKKDLKLVTVAGFPLGFQMTESKIAEIELALRDGADEVDMVFHLSAYKSGMPWPKIEVAKCSNLVHQAGKVLKVIIETAYLDADEIRDICKICVDAGADFVKTSTGMAPAGADLDKLLIMKKSIPDHVGLKASGGIKTLRQAFQFIEAGADRIGTSSGVKIIQELQGTSQQQ